MALVLRRKENERWELAARARESGAHGHLSTPSHSFSTGRRRAQGLDRTAEGECPAVRVESRRETSRRRIVIGLRRRLLMPGRFEPDSGPGRGAKRFKVDLIRRAVLCLISFARLARRRRLHRSQTSARLASLRAHSMRSRAAPRGAWSRQEKVTTRQDEPTRAARPSPTFLALARHTRARENRDA